MSGWIPESGGAGGVAVKKNGTLVATRSGVNFIEGTNVTLGVVDDPGNDEVDVTVSAAGGGGAGKSYATMPGLRPPDSPHASDIEFDAFANGVDPTAGPGMTWMNQGAALGAVNNGALILNSNGAATNSWRGLGVAAPAGNFTVDTAVTARLINNFHGAGVFFAWGGGFPTLSRGLEGLRYMYNSGIRITAHGTNTSYVGITDRLTAGPNPTLLAAPYSWLRLEWNSATETITYKHSTSGMLGTWVSLGTFAATGAGDPDFVVLAIEKNGQEIVAPFRFLRFDWAPDYDGATDA